MHFLIRIYFIVHYLQVSAYIPDLVLSESVYVSDKYRLSLKPPVKLQVALCLSFFMVAPIVIYILTYSLAPLGVSFFSDSTSPVFSLAVSGMRIYGLGFLFSGINIFSAIRLMSYGKGHLSGLITFLRSFVLLILFLTILPVKFGLYGLWSAMPDAEFLTLFISIPLLKWKPSAFSQK